MDKNRRSAFLVVSILAVAASTGSLRAVQHEGHSMQLAVIVDGSKTPDRIPDELAYQHFFLAISDPGQSSANAVSRQKAWLSRLELSAADELNLATIVNQLRKELDSIELSVNQVAADPNRSAAQKNQVLGAVKQQRQTAVAATVSRLRATMSAQGWSITDAHVRNHVKRNIVIYGTPAQ